jgi:hypothetical protein
MKRNAADGLFTKPSHLVEETMLHIILGLFFIALGIWGLFDEYYYVADSFKGGLPILLILSGLVATLAGFVPPGEKEETDG